jgi:hypothetical protein
LCIDVCPIGRQTVAGNAWLLSFISRQSIQGAIHQEEEGREKELQVRKRESRRE